MPFEPGNNANPNGARRHRRWIATLERAILADGGDKLRKAAEKLLEAAAGGEPWAIKELADRLDGRPVQQIDAHSPDGVPLAIAIVAYDPNTPQIPAPPLSIASSAGPGAWDEESGSGMAQKVG